MFPEILEWTTLTGMVNEMDSPRTFLKNLLFGNEQTLTTENILYSVISGGRDMAGFVKKNGEALIAGGYDEEERQISAPNIRIKRPLDAQDLIFRRHAGDIVFAEGSDVYAAAQREVARQLQRLNDLVDNTEEWMAAQALTGVIEYSSADEAHWQITYGKPSGNTITLTDFWNTSAGEPLRDIRVAKQTMHDEVGLNPTDCILGSEATDAFLANDEIRASVDRQSGINAGTLNFLPNVDTSGALFLGTFGSIRFWSYTSSVLKDGVSTPLIRAKYAEFINSTPAAENILYYAAHSDLDALDARLLASRRFSKSWKLPDPSGMQILLSSRPLPVMRRPGSVVSMKVVSG